MKKLAIITFFCSMSLLHKGVLAQELHQNDATQKSNFVINGKLGNLQAPAKIYLAYTTADGAWVRDSTQVINGAFTFKQYTVHPINALLSVSRDGKPTTRFQASDIARVYIEPGAKITLESNENIADRKIKGSKSEEFYKVYTDYVCSFDNKIDSIRQLAINRDNEARRPVLMKEMNRVLEDKRVQTKDYILKHPNQFVSLNLLEEYAGYSIVYADVQPVFEKLVPELKNSVKGKIFAEKLAVAKSSGVGVQAADFTQPDTAGVPVSLSSFRGKWVLIDFWASWCAPCRAESPVLKQAYEEFKSKNFDILAVSLDFNRTNWIKAIKDDGLTWHHVSDLKYWKNGVAVQYGVVSAPQNILVDPTGKIVAKNLRGEELKSKLLQLISK
jgi:Peroxiredoxin